VIVPIMTICLLGLVEPVKDLAHTGAYAEQHQLPILLYVSRSDCTFCKRFEDEVLGPLVRSGEFDDRALIVELIWDRLGTVVDFEGRQTTPDVLATRYDAKLTPTLLFLDSGGRPLVARIVGYGHSAFASYYLEKALTDARAELIRRGRAASSSRR
jgi:thioredoxin-related protein